MIQYQSTGIGILPGNGSGQGHIALNTVITAGSGISVEKDGKTLITFTPTINCQYLAVSSPDIASGEIYEIYSKNNLIATVIAGPGV